MKLDSALVVPAWIMFFGLFWLTAAPLGVAASIGVLFAGVVAVPALMLLALVRPRRSPHAVTARATRPVATSASGGTRPRR